MRREVNSVSVLGGRCLVCVIATAFGDGDDKQWLEPSKVFQSTMKLNSDSSIFSCRVLPSSSGMVLPQQGLSGRRAQRHCSGRPPLSRQGQET